MCNVNQENYLQKIIKSDEEWYFWCIPATLPPNISLGDRSTLKLTLKLKEELNKRYLISDEAERIEIIDWFIKKWGGIKNLKENKVKSYALDEIESIIANGIKNIPSWSKALAIRDPDNYAIYDSRVSVSLNGLIILGQIEFDNLFPMPKTRSKGVILEAQKLIKRYLRSNRLSYIPDNEFYDDYLGILQEHVNQPNTGIQMVEMALFAKAEEIALTLINHTEQLE